MTRETAQKHKKEILAFIDGAEIEYKDWQGIWRPAAAPSWDDDTDYRIKPREPREVWLLERDGEAPKVMFRAPEGSVGRYQVTPLIEILPDETP